MRGAFPLVGAGVCAFACAMVSACLDRPIAQVEPHSTNLFVAPAQNAVIDKLDLLFMIDNSPSMGDKQTLLAKAVPQLVNRLVVPRCVNDAGQIHVRATLDEACPAGLAPEFRAVKDIHVAVITSSLGSHGATGERVTCSGATGDDHARLLPSVRTGLTSYNNSGFLAWDPQRVLQPPGETDAVRFGQQFGDMVTKAGEDGCGYEGSLEAWYRFLVDPEPPLSIGRDKDLSVPMGIDTEILAQRAAFLRPDSLVAIVMLTDENDCSIRDDAYGYLLTTTRENGKDFHMLRGNSACEKDPNDPCCAPCSSGTQPNCPDVKNDPACQQGDRLPDTADKTNLRCLENKRRFGYDFLYPTSRYIDALTKTEVVKRSGEVVKNPLFSAPPGMSPRDQGLVYLAGIVGVPWQDIADDASLKGDGLRYLTAAELATRKRWDTLVGDASQNQRSLDPFMQESLEPRSGMNPITLESITPSSSMDPRANSINGHEHVNSTGDDLQYACTFRLSEPEACTGNSCDCDPTVAVAQNSPLCQPVGGGTASGTQYFGKAYPGLRPLEVLRGIGDSAIVASICPKVLEEGRPGYGYEPAVDSIVDQLRVHFNARCLPRPLAVQADGGGQLPCVVVEAAPPSGECSCTAARRHETTPEARQLVQGQLRAQANCDTATTPTCDSFCFCELSQAEGPALDQCLNDESGSDTPGYCYVDPYGADPHGNPALVKNCDSTSRQLIRFVGPDTPRPGTTAFIACFGATPN